MSLFRLASLLIIFFLGSKTLAGAEVLAALPSQVQDAGWPGEAKGVIRDLQSVRFTGALETEQVVLIDDALYLAFRPGRYSEFILLATDVKSVQVVPNSDGTQSLVLVQNTGMNRLGWDWDHAGYILTEALPSEFDSWKNVGRLWVQEVNGGQELYGYDAGAGKIRHASHSSGVWSGVGTLPCHGPLQEMVFVELDSTSPGPEMVQLHKYKLFVMSADGSQILDSVEAHATDSIAVVRNPGAGCGDLLAHSYMLNGSHWLRVWNEDKSSPGYALGTKDCTQILPRYGDQYGDHMLLTRGGLGDVDIVELHASTGPGGLLLERNSAGNWIDTHEDPAQRPVQAAGLVDLDLDGREDLMVAVLNGNNLELRNVMTRDLEDERWQNLETDAPELQALGDGDFEVKITMQVPQIASSTTVQVDVWARENPGTPQEVLHNLGRQFVTVPSGATQYEFTQTFTANDWNPTEAHFEMGFAPVDLDQLGKVISLYPSKAIAWAGPNAPATLVSIGVFWLNSFAGNRTPSSRRRYRRQGESTSGVGTSGLEQ
ncbi:MAG: hypothetical protein P1V35_09535 [Planctomycetota bacterium]|nr:hypothetical protein [Planctomycetota bacterium]